MPRRTTVLGRALALTLAVLAAACGGPEPAPSDEPSVVGGRVEAQGFVLEVALPTATYAVTDSIPVMATLTWTGAPGRGKIWGSGSGPASFGFQEIGGAQRAMGGAMTADCVVTEYPAGQPVAIPLRKSGGWTGEDPNAAFYTAWFNDPLLHLPAGHWQLRVGVDGYLDPCEMGARAINLTVGPIDITVR